MYSTSYIKQEKTCPDDGRRTVLDCLKIYGDCIGDKESFVFASYTGTREVVTWTELLDKSTSVAKSLIQLGVQPGEVVAINLRTCPEWLYIVFGTMLAGACVANISFTYKDGSDLIATMEKIANCCMLVMDAGVGGSNWDIVKPLLNEVSVDGTASSKKMQYLRYFIGFEVAGEKTMDGVKPVQDLIDTDNTNITLPEVTEDALGVLLQTSGSTGVPKLVALTQRNMMFINQSTTDIGGFLTQKNTQFNDRPFTWLGGFPWSVLCGQKRVTITGFEPVPEDRVSRVIDIIAREQCNLVSALPPMIHAMDERKNEFTENWPVKSLITAGQPIQRNVAKAFESISPTIVTAYGATEFFVIMVGVSTKDTFREYCNGKLVPGPEIEIKIVDENQEIVPVNTKGEIYVRAPSVFQGYYNDPEKTAAVKTSDGWFKTDDVASMTENGEFFVYGRKSNMIISGGMNVTPEILEHSILQCPGIAAVVVVPIPDEVYYQVLCACLVREKGSDVTEEQVRAFCEDIHNDKPKLFTVLPKHYVFMDSIPETDSGKISRPTLRKIVENMFKC